MKVNMSYVKGEKQSFELKDQGGRARKSMEMKEIHNFALAAGGIQFGAISKNELSDVFTKWSQMTFEDDSINETWSKFRTVESDQHFLVRILFVFPVFSQVYIISQGLLQRCFRPCQTPLFGYKGRQLITYLKAPKRSYRR